MTRRGHLKTIVAMAKHTRGEYFIPSSYSRIVARVLKLQERDLPRLLLGTGLPVEVLLAGDESRMTGQQQLQVMNNARAMGRAPDFGLREAVEVLNGPEPLALEWRDLKIEVKI